MAPADSEDRQVPREGLARERQLEVVASPVDASEPGVRVAAVERGVDVDSAGEQQPIKPVEHGSGVLRPLRRQHQRNRTRALHGARVVLPHPVVARPVAVPERDADDGPRHMRSGTGTPISSSRISIWRTKASTTKARAARSSSLAAWSSVC